MKALILAAGYATRLYPLTKDNPKPLLEVAKKPIIEYIIDHISGIKEIDKIYIITNDKFYPNFSAWRNNFVNNKDIAILNDESTDNENRLGAVGDIYFAVEKENIDEDLLVIAGDNLFDFNLSNFTKHFQKHGTSVAVKDFRDKKIVANLLGVVELDENNRIANFEEKPENPKTALGATACYLFTKQDLNDLKECIISNNIPDNSGDFISYLSQKKDVFGYVFTESWFDIGSLDQLEEANKHYKE